MSQSKTYDNTSVYNSNMINLFTSAYLKAKLIYLLTGISFN